MGFLKEQENEVYLGGVGSSRTSFLYLLEAQLWVSSPQPLRSVCYSPQCFLPGTRATAYPLLFALNTPIMHCSKSLLPQSMSFWILIILRWLFLRNKQKKFQEETLTFPQLLLKDFRWRTCSRKGSLIIGNNYS